MNRNGTTWPGEAIGNLMLKQAVEKEDMEELLKVTFLGKADEAESEADNDEKNGDKKDTDSKQLDDPFGRLASGEFVPPKFSPTIWAQALEQNTRLARCIRSFARNTVGLGWHIEPIHPITNETPDKEKKIIEEQSEWLRGILSYPNKDMPLSEIFYLMKVDEEATGNGYIEVVRNNAGDIVRLYHAPATTMRIRVMKDESGEQDIYGFVQIRGNQKRYFKDFGDRRVMDTVTGKWYEGGSALSISRRASEIIHFKIYDPTSSFYGAPRYVPASAAIAGNRMAAIRNVSFFDNDAVPRMALLVSGGRLTAESQNQIEDFFRAKAKGPEQAHRVMVIQVEPTKVGFQQQTKTMVELKPLTVGVTEDASFSAYRNANDEEIREIFGMAPVFFSTENVNKASSAVSREITNEQEFEPDRLTKEYQINQTIVHDLLCSLLGNNPETPDDEKEMVEYRKNIRVQFRFARLTLTDPLDQANMDEIYASLGAMTPNELRERIGKAPYPKDYFFAEKPLAIAMAELSAGLAMAIAMREEEQFPPPPAPPAPAMPGLPEGLLPSDQLPDSALEPGEEAPEPPTGESEAPPEGAEASPEVAAAPVAIPQGKAKRSLDPNTALGIAMELMGDARRLATRGATFGGGLYGRRGGEGRNDSR